MRRLVGKESSEVQADFCFRPEPALMGHRTKADSPKFCSTGAIGPRSGDLCTGEQDRAACQVVKSREASSIQLRAATPGLILTDKTF